MINMDIKIGIDQTMAIGICHIEIKLSIDKILEEGHCMIKIKEVVLRKAILEECRIVEVRIWKMDIEVILGMINVEEVGVGLE